MSDSDYCTLSELMFDQFLNFLLCHDVDVGRGLIEHHNPILAKDSAADTNKLTLAGTQVRTTLTKLKVDTLPFVLPGTA